MVSVVDGLCLFCTSGADNPQKFGQRLEKDGITVHYFCMVCRFCADPHPVIKNTVSVVFCCMTRFSQFKEEFRTFKASYLNNIFD